MVHPEHMKKQVIKQVNSQVNRRSRVVLLLRLNLQVCVRQMPKDLQGMAVILESTAVHPCEMEDPYLIGNLQITVLENRSEEADGFLQILVVVLMLSILLLNHNELRQLNPGVH